MIVAIDETPVGVFVEIEGGEQGIETAAAALGRSQADFIVDSYRSLFLQHRDRFGLTTSDMVFDTDSALLRTAAADLESVESAGGSPLRALILAAGLGTRLRPLTSVRAKAAVPVNGVPLVAGSSRGWCPKGSTIWSSTCTIIPRRSRGSSATGGSSAPACATRGNSRCSDRPAGPAGRCRCSWTTPRQTDRS